MSFSRPNSSRAFLCPKYFVLIVFFILSPPLTARAAIVEQIQTDPTVRQIPIGETIKGDIKGSEIRKFKLRLEPGQYARVVVERHAIDLTAKVTAPGSDQSINYENPAGAESPLFFSILANVAGDYAIEISPTDKWLPLASYSIHVEEVRPVNAMDDKRIDAERAVAEGRRLQLLGTAESRKKAVGEYEKALPIWQELNDKFETANTLHFIAQTQKALEEYQPSIDQYQQVLQLREGDNQAVAYTLLDLAAAYRDFRKPADELPLYQKALSTFKSANNRRAEAVTLYRIGLLHANQQDMDTALQYYKQALAIHQLEGNRYEEARTLNAMGGSYDGLLQPKEAKQHYLKAIEGWEATGDLGQKGNTLNNIAKLLDDAGEFQNSIDMYMLALDFYKKSEASDSRNSASIRRPKSRTLQNLGNLYIRLGDLPKALEYLQQAEALRSRLDGRPLMQIGYAYALAGKPQEALDYCNRALQIQLENNDPHQAETYTVIGMAKQLLDLPEEAIQNYQKARKIQQDPEAPDPQAQAITLTNMGSAYIAMRQPALAVERLNEARTIFHSFGERNGEAMTLYGLARAERDRGNREAALKWVEEALGLIEPLRSNITSHELRTSYYATKINPYELYVDLQMQGGAHVAAFEASERSRARALLDLLADARVDLIPTGNTELRTLVQERQLTLRNIRNDWQLRAQKKTTAEIAAADRELNELSAQKDRIEEKIKSMDRHYAAVMFPQPLSASQVQQLLDPDTVMLEFFLGDERSYAWALTPTTLKGYSLPPRSEIAKSAQRLKEHLSQGKILKGETAAAYRSRLIDIEAKYWQEAAAFSRMLLGPVADQLKNKTLLIVADGELNYLPFAALPTPGGTTNEPLSKPLAVDHTIVNLPSGSVLAVLRQNAQRSTVKGSVAVFADPIVDNDDPRIYVSKNKTAPPAKTDTELARSIRDTEEGDPNNPKLFRLAFTNEEARYILSVSSPASMKAVGFQATRENAMSKELRRYQIVHFATHGILNKEHPEKSGLVLSLFDQQGRYHEEGFLRLNDIYGMSLAADLVVLSACRTGLGKEVRGEGLIGLTQGFMYAGTSRVVASLWKVNDEATAELMKIFYRKMLKEQMSPAAALREAQLTLAQDERWHNPYFWAGFVLQGEWR